MKLITLDNLTRAVRQLEAELPDTLVGATSSQNGESGVVPAPAIADQDKFLRGDGSWDDPDVITDERIEEILNTELDDIVTVNTNVTLNDILNAVYPIGSYYFSDNSTSPASLFGGAWEPIQGKFLLGADSTYTAGSTGGEAEHTLTINEMPSHKHSLWYRTSIITNGSSGTWYFDIGTAGTEYTNSPSLGNTGGDQAHNNMPPYKAVYIWHRIA